MNQRISNTGPIHASTFTILFYAIHSIAQRQLCNGRWNESWIQKYLPERLLMWRDGGWEFKLCGRWVYSEKAINKDCIKMRLRLLFNAFKCVCFTISCQYFVNRLTTLYSIFAFRNATNSAQRPNVHFPTNVSILLFIPCQADTDCRGGGRVRHVLYRKQMKHLPDWAQLTRKRLNSAVELEME